MPVFFCKYVWHKSFKKKKTNLSRVFVLKQGSNKHRRDFNKEIPHDVTTMECWRHQWRTFSKFRLTCVARGVKGWAEQRTWRQAKNFQLSRGASEAENDRSATSFWPEMNVGEWFVLSEGVVFVLGREIAIWWSVLSASTTSSSCWNCKPADVRELDQPLSNPRIIRNLHDCSDSENMLAGHMRRSSQLLAWIYTMH